MRIDDTWEFQTARLKKLLAERAPGRIITFDENHKLTVRFRIVDPVTGTELVGASGEWRSDQLADKSDDKLWQLIRHLSTGKL
jgi:hypothetical protein